MTYDGFSWIAQVLDLKDTSRKVMALLWVEGYTPQAAASELGKSYSAVKMCAGRNHLRAYGRAKAAHDAATEAQELKQRRAAAECAREREDKGWETDIAAIEAAEAAFSERQPLAAEAPLWRLHLLEKERPDFNEEPDALMFETVEEHAGGIRSTMKGPRKSVRQAPELDVNGRPILGHPTLVTFGEYKQIVSHTCGRPARMPTALVDTC